MLVSFENPTVLPHECYRFASDKSQSRQMRRHHTRPVCPGLATAATTDPLFRNSLRKPRTTGVLLSAKITEMQKESLSDSYDRSIGDAALIGNLNETD